MHCITMVSLLLVFVHNFSDSPIYVLKNYLIFETEIYHSPSPFLPQTPLVCFYII